VAETMNPPLVSVVMSLYNSERYLTEAMDSILAQTFTDFEFIIIDDGSKDRGADIVRSYEDPRIRCFWQENAGLPAALNFAVRNAQADVVARMDPDDICMPDRLAKQYNYLMHHPDVVIVGSNATCIDDTGNKLEDVQMRPFYATGEFSLPESPCVHPSVIFRRSAFERAGGYPERMRYGGEDAVLFNKMMTFGAISNIPEPLISYRLSHSSMSHKSREFNRLLREMVLKEVSGEAISNEDWQILADAYKHSASGHYGYYLYIGKLFLTSSGKESIARTYIIKALRNSPLSLHAWMCLAGSFIPEAWRAPIRSYLKNLKRIK